MTELFKLMLKFADCTSMRGDPTSQATWSRWQSIFSALVGLLSSTMTLGHAIGVFSVSAYGLLVLSACRLPETKGKELSEAEHHHLFERQEISTVSRKQV